MNFRIYLLVFIMTSSFSIYAQSSGALYLNVSVDLPTFYANKYEVDVKRMHYGEGGTKRFILGNSINIDYEKKNYIVGIGIQRMHIITNYRRSYLVTNSDVKSIYANVNQFAIPIRLGYSIKLKKDQDLNFVMNKSVYNPQLGNYDIEYYTPDTVLNLKPTIPVVMFWGLDLSYNINFDKHWMAKFTGMVRHIKQNDFPSSKYPQLSDAAIVHGWFGGFGIGLNYKLF